MSTHALCRTVKIASFCIGFGLPFRFISGFCLVLRLSWSLFCLLLHLSWYLLCFHFGFCILLRHLRWYLSRLQFIFFFLILLRRSFSFPFVPSFWFLVPPSVLVLVPLSTVVSVLVPLSAVVSVYDPTRDV